MRSLVISIVLLLSHPAADATSATLELTGQSGVLGEWEVTGSLAATDAKNEFSGPLTLKHMGLCTQDGPETKSGEIRLQLVGASRLRATLTIDGAPCTYSATKSDAYTGTMTCRDRRGVPLRVWLK